MLFQVKEINKDREEEEGRRVCGEKILYTHIHTRLHLHAKQTQAHISLVTDESIQFYTRDWPIMTMNKQLRHQCLLQQEMRYFVHVVITKKRIITEHEGVSLHVVQAT